MRKFSYLFIALALGLAGAFSSARANAADFYAGKTLNFIVGYRAGGGYDAFTRTLSRHIGRHIPGNPSAVVDNRGGAGSLIAANYVYNAAKPDGLTLGVIGAGLVTQQALGARGIKFDAKKLHWLGSMSVGTPICAIMGFTGFKTLDEVLHSKKKLKQGSTGAGSTTDDLPRLMMGLLDAPFEVIPGFKGTSSIRVAMQRKELDGACWTWESMRTTARAMLNAKGDQRLIPYVMEGTYEDPEVKNLPQFTDVIKGEDNLKAFKAWLNPYKFFRPIILPPKTPKDRVEILQTALKETMHDPKFLEDAKKSKLDVTYVSADDVEKYISEILDISPGAKKKLESMIASKGKKK
ncbi:MAG TPA: tripartite tricarboxylate transporter substrate-binding protein [Terriglobales bacterium]|nr:tripartite tricarboxylate transporter substrate-binding protein [Terriglobales bacterium]